MTIGGRAMTAAVLVASLVACSSGQDPGIEPAPAGGPSTTSRPLLPCPDGGPDATTDPAGCLDAEGQVVRP